MQFVIGEDRVVPASTQSATRLEPTAEMECQRVRRTGYLVLPDAPGAKVAERLRRRVATICTERPSDVDGTGGTVYLPGLETDPVVATTFDHPAILEWLHCLLGAPPRMLHARYRSPKPGRGAQALHRDEPWPQADGRWSTVTVMVGLVAFGAANGATRIVPGTHLDRAPFVSRSVKFRHPGEVVLVGPAGSSFLFTGACLHSGTTNSTVSARPGIQATFVSAGQPPSPGQPPPAGQPPPPGQPPPAGSEPDPT